MPRKATAKKSTRKTTAAKKSTTRKTAAKKATAKKTTARKTTAKKPAARKTTAKKATAKKSTARKTTAKKATAKKSTARKSTAKRATAKKAVVTRKAAATTPISDAYSKSQLLNTISEETGIARKEVSAVLESLANVVERHVKKRGAGQFTLPGLLKIVTTRKPATKARKGINPFTGEETVFKAKPARTVVKIRALKKLKDMVA